MALGLGHANAGEEFDGDLRVDCIVDASQWATQFQANAEKREVKLWAMPWIGLEYSKQLRHGCAPWINITAAYMANMAIYMEDSVVSRARLAHLAGKFGSSIEEDGALGQYMSLRIDDATLERLEIDPDLQKQFLIRRSSIDESPEQFQQRIKFMRPLCDDRNTKDACSCRWLISIRAITSQPGAGLTDGCFKCRGPRLGIAPVVFGRAIAIEQLGYVDEALEYYKKIPRPKSR